MALSIQKYTGNLIYVIWIVAVLTPEGVDGERLTVAVYVPAWLGAVQT